MPNIPIYYFQPTMPEPDISGRINTGTRDREFGALQGVAQGIGQVGEAVSQWGEAVQKVRDESETQRLNLLSVQYDAALKAEMPKLEKNRNYNEYGKFIDEFNQRFFEANKRETEGFSARGMEKFLRLREVKMAESRGDVLALSVAKAAKDAAEDYRISLAATLAAVKSGEAPMSAYEARVNDGTGTEHSGAQAEQMIYEARSEVARSEVDARIRNFPNEMVKLFASAEETRKTWPDAHYTEAEITQNLARAEASLARVQNDTFTRLSRDYILRNRPIPEGVIKDNLERDFLSPDMVQKLRDYNTEARVTPAEREARRQSGYLAVAAIDPTAPEGVFRAQVAAARTWWVANKGDPAAGTDLDEAISGKEVERRQGKSSVFSQAEMTVSGWLRDGLLVETRPMVETVVRGKVVRTKSTEVDSAAQAEAEQMAMNLLTYSKEWAQAQEAAGKPVTHTTMLAALTARKMSLLEAREAGRVKAAQDAAIGVGAKPTGKPK